MNLFFSVLKMHFPLVVLFLFPAVLSAETIIVYTFNNEFSINPPGETIVRNATIFEGDIILWQHMQGNHTTTSVIGSSEQWDSEITNSVPTFSYQFNTAGVYWYYCIPHGTDNMDGTASGMYGTITVLSAGSGACCLPDGMCITTSGGDCAAQNGVFSGPGTSCANTLCQYTVEIIANADNVLYQSATGTISNALGNHLFAGNNNNGVRRPIISFDLSSLPEGVQIDNAQIRLYCTSNTGDSYPITLHKVNESWIEGTSQAGGNEQNGTTALTGDVTWLHRTYNTLFWTTPGGTIDTASVATTSINAQNTAFAWSSSELSELVDMWYQMPVMNRGLILRGDEATTNNTKRFASRHVETVSQRPTLIVTYSFPKIGACCFADGSCDGLTEMECMMTNGTFLGVETNCMQTSCPIQLTPYLDSLPLPGVAVPTTGTSGGAAHYNMYITEQFQTIHSELPPTRVWGYNGSYPGPTIEAFKDQLVTVEWHNNLRVFETQELRTQHVLNVDTCMHGPHLTGQVPVTVTHLHGGKVDSFSDGPPEDAFAPGQSSGLYSYPNIQPAGTLWYHDHALGITRLNVMMGLAGLYNLRDNNELALNLPSGEFEVPLVIQDKSFNADGTMRYPEHFEDHFFGDVLMVNGKVWPYFNVKQGKYRFRVVNGSNSRSYVVALSTGDHFYQIGSDLGFLSEPVMLNELPIHPGERYDIVIDFANYAAGTEIILTNNASAPFSALPGIGVIPNVMKFIVQPQPGFNDSIPQTLVYVPPMDTTLAVIERIFELVLIPDHGCESHGGHNGGQGGSLMWSINGLMWNDITEFPILDSYEIWTWHNESGMSHPMHIHLVAFQILHRQAIDPGTGQAIGPLLLPEDHEKGWKDTAHSPTGYRTSIMTQFTGFTGIFPYHCHILEHEDHEMMRQFMVVEPTYGCMDSDACNYNPDANISDDSCYYTTTPTATLTQPTCAITTGTIVIANQTDVEYSINGTDYFANNEFTSLAPGDYTLYVRSTIDNTCITESAGGVTVEENIYPIALCTSPFTIQLDTKGQASITVADIDAGSTNNCGIDTITLSQSTFTCADLGENEIILTVTDVAGNKTTCSTTITVLDVIAPVVNCFDFTLELESNGNAFLTPEDLGETSTDNCSITITEIDFEKFDCSDIGAPVLVTYFASDVSGNIASCTAMVNVVDNLGPVIDCPDDMTVNIDTDSITYTIPDFFGEGIATATDNCAIQINILSQNPTPGTLLLDGIYTVALSATDEYGNESSCSFELTVDAILGIDDRIDFNGLTLYSNPTENEVTIGNPQFIAIDKISIYDIQGRLVFTINTYGNKSNQTINVSDLSSASYTVVIESNGKQAVKRLIRK